jgi:CBS domain-containing protein
MLIRELVTTPAIFVSPGTPVRDVAWLMKKHDIGAVPIVLEAGPVGLVTDRDLVVRMMSKPDCTNTLPISEVMSPTPISCFVNQDVVEAAAIMGDNQVRRLLVLDRNGSLIGVLSVGDIAENASEQLAGQALGEIVETR